MPLTGYQYIYKKEAYTVSRAFSSGGKITVYSFLFYSRQRGPREDHRVDMVAHEGDSKIFKELNPTADKTVKGGSKQGLLI